MISASALPSGKIDVLFVLQNAWRYSATPATRDWSDRTWEVALWRSQTGKRLKEMIPPSAKFVVCNASPRVGNHSRSAYPPDPKHFRSLLEQHQPRLVVLLGTLARQLGPVCGAAGVVYMEAPHPAWRVLSKVQTAALRLEIERKLRGGRTSWP